LPFPSVCRSYNCPSSGMGISIETILPGRVAALTA
jgi:hypothetical protein